MELVGANREFLNFALDLHSIHSGEGHVSWDMLIIMSLKEVRINFDRWFDKGQYQR